ncbi:MAG: HlyD family efflux transporter periplasmic adaptor subunit [Anaerolineae bacterium]|jgi:multidrug resistance efflux pump
MHKPQIALLVVALVSMLLTSCGIGQKAEPTPVATVPPVVDDPHLLRGGGVTASGEIVPAQEVQLSFALAGQVRSVGIEPDDVVQAGDVLVVLVTDGLEAQVAQAKAAVNAARANLARLTAGARPEEIASAEDGVALAQVQIAQAEAALEAAGAQYAAAQSAVDTARAGVHAAQAQYQQIKAGASQMELVAVEADVKLAEAQLRQAQAAYDVVQGSPNIQMRPEALALEQATIACQAARARYQAVLGGASVEALDAARAQVESAQVAVTQAEHQALAARAQVDQATSAVEAAQVQQVQAEHQVALLEAGATAEEIAAAEAQVAQAEAALQAARAALDQATLVAPFDGTVTALQVGPGEAVVPGQIVLALADLSRLRTETTDLSERDVAGVVRGQAASVYVEALGEQIDGSVVGIAPQATTLGGDVVYTVRVDLTEQPPGLRWGMSTEVEIDTD